MDYIRLVPRADMLAQMESLVDELEACAESLGANTSVMQTIYSLRAELERMREEEDEGRH